MLTVVPRLKHLPFGRWWQEARSPCQGEHAQAHSRSLRFHSSLDLQTDCKESRALPDFQETGERESGMKSKMAASHLRAQFIHLHEVPGGRPSQSGGVLHEDHLALELLHGDHLAILQPGSLKLVEARHLHSRHWTAKLISAGAMGSISNQSLR